MHLRYLVTGTGRSGTVGLAAALTSAGIPCSHERFFKGVRLEETVRLLDTQGGENSLCSQSCGLPRPKSPVRAESSYLAAPYLNASCLAAATVIHAVRNPWKVILSFLNHIQFFRGEPEHEHERFVYAVLPQLHAIDNPVDRAVYYYIHWNRMIERLARNRGPKRYLWHRVEDGPECLLRKLNLPEDVIARCRKKEDANTFREWPKELRDRASAQRVRVEHLYAGKYAAELRNLAKEYGYETPTAAATHGKTMSGGVLGEGRYEVRFFRKPRLLEAGYRGYNLVRWRTDCFALPQGGKPIDLEKTVGAQLREQVARGDLVVARRLAELKQKVDEMSGRRVRNRGRGLPLLVEHGYRCYNLVLWGREYYALHQQSLADFALEKARASLLEQFRAQGILVIAPSLRAAREKVDQVVRKHPELERGQPLELPDAAF